MEKAAARVRLLKSARPLFQTHSLQTLAGLFQTSAPTLCRLRQDYAHLSDAELTPENLAVPFTSGGRKSKWDAFAGMPDVRRRLQELYLLSCGASSDYMTKGRRTGSAAAALKVFSQDALCPAELSRELRRGAQPKPLLNAIREITDLIEQRHRGGKHASLNGTLTHRRTLVEILQDGRSIAIQPGDWWVFDDMSDNLPHWWTGPEATPLVGRQGLYAYDVTQRWLGVEKLGTVRDSYTAAIILRFLRQLMETLGKPRRGVVFERSVWQARIIAGPRVTAGGGVEDEQVRREPMPDAERALIQDGLEAMGLRVHYTYTPRGKEIEGAFNYLQRLKPMFAGTKPVNIGRHAGEFEHGAKQLRRARAGSHTPEALGFLHIDASRDLDLRVMEFINGERPLEPYPVLAPLSRRDYAVFLPQHHELEIRNGKVTATVQGTPFDFCAPELFASIGSGYRVAIRFDPSEPDLGAALYNRETASGNFRGWQLGELIGWAEYLPPVARFDWREAKDDPAGDIKSRHNGYVRTAFGAVGIKHERVSTVRDGKGNVGRVEHGSARVSRAGSGVPPESSGGNRHPEAQPTLTRAARQPAPPLSRSAMEDPELRELLEETH
jgi:hypothetical protein